MPTKGSSSCKYQRQRRNSLHPRQKVQTPAETRETSRRRPRPNGQLEKGKPKADPTPIHLRGMEIPPASPTRLLDPSTGMNYVHLTDTLVDSFNALANEVQSLADRKTVLEHKLRFAHEQVRVLACAFSRSSFSLSPSSAPPPAAAATAALRWEARWVP